MKKLACFSKKVFLDNILFIFRITCLISLLITFTAGNLYALTNISYFNILIFPITFCILYAASYVSSFVKNNSLYFFNVAILLFMFFIGYLIYIHRFTSNILVIIFSIIFGILFIHCIISTLYSNTEVVTSRNYDKTATKSIFLSDFTEVITRYINHSEERTEKNNNAEKLRYLSFHDSLTGLYNRAFFEEELNRLDSDRQLPLSIILGDVNGLKLTNDTFGHKLGDCFLKSIAKILVDSCRKEDIVARLGGDEFAIILPQTNEEGVKSVCRRIKEECIKHVSNPIQPSISLGYAIKTLSNQNMDKMFRIAENMMYENKVKEGKYVRKSIITSLKDTLELKTSETKDHSLRMKELSTKLAYYMGLSSNEIKDLALLAMLHDIGKAAIPEDILEKPEALTKEEWDLVKSHSEIGYRIAISTAEIASIANCILYHHEHWDGSGYPLGLTGSEIPKLSRILSIIDAYDVMTFDRPYSKALSKNEAIEEIRRCSGSQFDPDISRVFIDMLLRDCEVCS